MLVVLLFAAAAVASPAAEPVEVDGPRPAAAAAKDVPYVLPAKAGEQSFTEKYFPFFLAEKLHPDVDKNVVALWILTAIPFTGLLLGPLWIPTVVTGLVNPEGYTNEALLNWAIHLGIFILGSMTTYVFGIGFLIIAINCLYLYPVATINMFNHHVQRTGARKRADAGPATPTAPNLAMVY